MRRWVGVVGRVCVWIIRSYLTHHCHTQHNTTSTPKKQLAAAAVAVLEEAAALRPALQQSIAQRLPQYALPPPPAVIHSTRTPQAQQQQQQRSYHRRMRGLLLRLLGCDAGAAFLAKNGYLDALFSPQHGGDWAVESSGAAFRHYPRAVERRLAQAALAMANAGDDDAAAPLPPVPAPPSASSVADAEGGWQQQQRPRPTPIVVRCQELASLFPGAGPAHDTRALLALPWRIEVRWGGKWQ